MFFRFAALFTLTIAACAAHGQALSHDQIMVGGAIVERVRVRLRGGEISVQPVLAGNRAGRSDALSSLVNTSGGAAGITGTFFDTRTLLPVGDIVVDGKLRHFGGRGAALTLTKTRSGLRARMRDGVGIGRHTDWGRATHVLGGGMWVVRGGKVALSPRKQGFRDAGLFRSAARTAVGISENGDLLLLATKSPLTLGEWAHIVQKCGAKNALNYDGGSSTGLVVRGRSVLRPARAVTNALVVFENRNNQDKIIPIAKNRTVARSKSSKLTDMNITNVY